MSKCHSDWFLCALLENCPVLGELCRSGALSFPNYGVHLHSTGHLVRGASLEVCAFSLPSQHDGSRLTSHSFFCVLFPGLLLKSTSSFRQAVLRKSPKEEEETGIRHSQKCPRTHLWTDASLVVTSLLLSLRTVQVCPGDDSAGFFQVGRSLHSSSASSSDPETPTTLLY